MADRGLITHLRVEDSSVVPYAEGWLPYLIGRRPHQPHSDT
jgi:hypothetical protein